MRKSGKLILRQFASGLLCASAAALTACNYNRESAGFYREYEVGHFQTAAAIASDKADHASSRDEVVLRLEQGNLQRAAGQFAASNASFDAADQLITHFDDEPDVKVSQESLAAAVNQTALDYRGYAYDKIMMNTYEALNYLQLGDLDRARVELRRAYERQQQAVEKYNRKIAADKQLRQEKKSDYDVDQAMDDPSFRAGLDEQYNELNVQDLSAYKNYVNPFTEYLRGLYLMYAGVDSSDLEQAATAMRRTAGMVGDNTYVKQDAVTAEKLANGGRVEPTTYLIYESGLAPTRGEIKIHIPIPFRAGRAYRVDYVGAAFPRLIYHRWEAGPATIDTRDGSYATALVCNMDKVISQEFKNELPIVITRTLISTGIKAVAQLAAVEATRRNATASLIADVLTAGYSFATNQADLRTWRSLPKRFGVARFPTPSDRHIHLTVANGEPIDLMLADGVVNVVYVKCVTPEARPIVEQFKLK